MNIQDKDYSHIISGAIKVARLQISMEEWGILDAVTGGIFKYRIGPIVEIGMGASTILFANHAKKKGIPLYSCDVIMGGIFGAFDNKLFVDHHCFIGKSEEFLKDLDVEPLIAFIDGEHTYETVKMESDILLDKLQMGGVLFMHDTFPVNETLLTSQRAGDVWKLRKELERNMDLDVFSWPYSIIGSGLTMVMKHPKNQDRLHWLRNGRYDSQ